MAPKIADLRAKSDEDLIREHDDMATNTGVSIGSASLNYYLEELRRREAVRAEEAAYELARSSNELAVRASEIARRAYRTGILTAVIAGISAIAAIVGIFATLAAGHATTDDGDGWTQFPPFIGAPWGG